MTAHRRFDRRRDDPARSAAKNQSRGTRERITFPAQRLCDRLLYCGDLSGYYVHWPNAMGAKHLREEPRVRQI